MNGAVAFLSAKRVLSARKEKALTDEEKLQELYHVLESRIPDGFELHAVKKDGRLTFSQLPFSTTDAFFLLFAYQYYAVLHGSDEEREAFIEQLEDLAQQRGITLFD